MFVRSDFYEELSIPTPIPKNTHSFITQLCQIGQNPKFCQCYFLGNIKNIKLYILGHILVPVLEDPGEAAGYLHVPARLLLSFQEKGDVTYCKSPDIDSKPIQSNVQCFINKLISCQQYFIPMVFRGCGFKLRFNYHQCAIMGLLFWVFLGYKATS